MRSLRQKPRSSLSKYQNCVLIKTGRLQTSTPYKVRFCFSLVVVVNDLGVTFVSYVSETLDTDITLYVSLINLFLPPRFYYNGEQACLNI